MEKRLRYLQFLDEEPERAVKSYFRRQSDWFRRFVADEETPEELTDAELAS